MENNPLDHRACTVCGETGHVGHLSPAESEQRTKSYDVHIFAVVRVKVPNVEAGSQEEAIRDADVNLYSLFAHHATWDEIETEYAEEQAYYLVDEAGDEEHGRTRWHDGEFRIVDDLIHHPIPCTTA